MSSRIGLFLTMACVCFLFLTGCGGGPSIGTVTGIITLDGEPIEGASIAFYPTEGRASMGSTDATGKYELVYSRDSNGAVIGEHRVTIRTEIDEEVDYSDSNYEESDTDNMPTANVVSKARKESLPPKYTDPNSTELKASVVGGANKIDFALTSE